MIINVLEYLEYSYEKKTHKIVFSDEHNEITYEELVDKSKRIGSWISKRYNVKNKPIAVLIDRNIESLVMFLGVVYSGNFYVPIDMNLPNERIKSMFCTISPITIIGFESYRNPIEQLGYEFNNYSDISKVESDHKILDDIRSKMIDTDPLYAIFTSGSTGVQKAVLISHRSVIDLVECFKETFEFSDNDIFGNQAPFDFDVSVKDIYSTLKNSATMQIIPKQLFVFPVKLIDYLNERKITTVIWATTALCVVANLRAMRNQKPLYLEKIMFSGEVMPIKILNYWKDNLPDAKYVNLYGPTEITCNCSYYKVSREYELNEVLPIGIPFKNTDIIVLNEKNQPVVEEEIGELCVRGTSLALGYYNNTEKTQEMFCQNPLNAVYPERIYRTGDLVKYNKMGELIYCSRKDFQVKHMGHRIELGEIEVAANAIDFVERSCCLYDEERGKIILFYQSEREQNEEVLSKLSECLPKYMIPACFICMKSIPLNKNAKIDRTKLKEKYIN